MTNTKETKTMTTAEKVWVQLQYVVLAMTVAGQVFTNINGYGVLVAQSIWLVANCIALIRDFKLHRPVADKTKNAVLTGITMALVIMAIVNM